MTTRLVLALALLSTPSLVTAADVQPICADRPGKATPTCTVPAGMVQIETGIADWTHDRSGGATVDSLELGATSLKYGLSSRWHLEVDVVPYTSLRIKSGGDREFDSTFGDLTVRSKYRFTDGDGIQVAMLPAVKIPTASAPIGDRKLEAGITVPIGFSIPNSPFAVSLAPEVDWLADADREAHHLAMTQVIALGWQASSKLTLTAELWSQWNWDPIGTVRQSTADAAIAYVVNDDLSTLR